jgi:DNA-binding protein YbaB
MTMTANSAVGRRTGDIRRRLAATGQMIGSDSVTGTAGGGAVRTGVGDEFSFTSVEIGPRFFDPAETELAEDLLSATVRKAARRLAGRRSSILGGLAADENAPEPPAGPPPVVK